MIDAGDLLEPLRRIHDGIRDAVVTATERRQLDELAHVDRDNEGDTIYAAARMVLLVRSGVFGDPFRTRYVAMGLKDDALRVPPLKRFLKELASGNILGSCGL